MTALLETLASYVSALTIRHYADNPLPLKAPVLERFQAAVLFADIGGFSALTERLAQRGPAGIEELTQHLNAYFGQLITLITSHGGDVVKFAGDAMLAVWPAGDESLATVTHRAAQCSLAILTELRDYRADEVHLTLHLGIGAGETIGLHVGGVKGRWEFLIAGATLVQIASAEAHAKPGEVCISPEGWVLIQDQYEGTVLESGDVRLNAARQTVSPRPAMVPMMVPEMATALRAYIPPGILARLDAGQNQWLAEFRSVTVLFVQLQGLDDAAISALQQVQQAMQAMQRAVYQYEGTIRQFIRDDKGTVLVAAFGLPPFAHEEDAVRGVQAALVIQENLRSLGLGSAIGITTGRVYCGSVGSNGRCEYAMVGNVVNLAARLMVAAQDEVWCDGATYQAAKSRLRFDSLPAIRVKGKVELVPIYRPQKQGQRSVLLGDGMPLSEKSPMVGRRAERQLLDGKLQALLQGDSGVAVIEGEPGIGKSRLVESLLEQAQSLGVKVLFGAGDAIEKSTSYYAWRSVFSHLLELELLADPKAQCDRVLKQLSSHSLSRFAPLLKAVLPLDLPENEITAQMTGQVRADNTRELLVQLLQAAADCSPLMLVLEDVQWLDSLSWALALAMSQRVRPLLLVIATRPITERLSAEYRKLLRANYTQHLRLEALPPEDTLALVCQRLGVGNLPLSVADLIRQKAEGNPFFSEELAYALRDTGLILIEDGECKLAPGIEDLRAQNLGLLQLPDTVQGIITSRIDRLSPLQQLTLKVASVIGRVFAFRVLRDIYPIEADKVHLIEYLYTLERLDLTPLESPEPDLAYIFKHIITQEVAYNLMLFSQRRLLHYAVAEWYERTYVDDLSPFYPALAYHWSYAVETGQGWSLAVSKALHYLEKAGEQALRSHSLQEAVRFFCQALTLYAAELRSGGAGERESGRAGESGNSQLPITNPKICNLQSEICNSSLLTPLRRARWERQLAEAYLGLGQLPESREHLAKALILLGRPMPATVPKLAMNLLRQVLRQILHRLGYIRLQADFLAANPTLLETARVYDRLAEIYYHANETVAAIYAAMRTLNLAERAGLSPELASAYANSCFAAGVVPLHSLAEAYSRRARETAQHLQHLPSIARVLIVTSAYSIGVGQWGKVQESLDRAVEICDRLGDWHQWAYCLAILAKAAYLQGQFVRGVEIWARVYAVAQRRDDKLQQAWGLNGQAEGLLRLGRIDEAVGLLEESLILFAQNNDRVSETATYGKLAIARLCQGEWQLAQKAAVATQEKLAQFSSPNSYYLLQGYAGVAQVYLALWEAEQLADSGFPRQSKTSALAGQACKALHGYARIFPIGKPRAWLCQGLLEYLTGAPVRAFKAWHRSLAFAEQLAMPYAQGLAYYEMGRHTTGAERRQQLTRACEIFTELGATYDLALAQTALESRVVVASR